LKGNANQFIFSHSDFLRYMESLFAYWMPILCLEQPDLRKLKYRSYDLLMRLAETVLQDSSEYLDALKQSSETVIINNDKLSD
jgi:hypothetical protein